MLITLLNWAYVALTTYMAGHFLLPRIAKLLDKDTTINFKLIDYLISGFIIVTAYAGYFSIFYKVGAVANIVLLVLLSVTVYIDRKQYAEELVSIKSAKAGNILPIIIIGILSGLYVLLYTANSTFHYDTGLYHAQAIHWIEDYGCVKGMGLLHFRLAYNSTYFPICALYSFKPILGQSLHCLSGYAVWIVVFYSLLGLFNSIKNHTIFRKTAVSDMLRMAPLIFVLVVCMEITSPETDFIVTCMFLWLCIRFVEVAEKDVSNVTAFCLLAVSTFALIGYKLTSAIMVLLVLVPLVMLIKKKNWKPVIVCGVIAVVLILPYLIRNYLISGWLIYPFGGIDIFNVDWKIPRDVLDGDAGAIKQGSQVGNNGIPEGVSMEALGWLRTWWRDSGYSIRLFYSSLFLSGLTCGLAFVIEIIEAVKRKKKELYDESKAYDGLCLCLMMILGLCLVYWFILGPAIRYGYSFVFTFPNLVVGYVMYKGYCRKEKLKANKALAVIDMTVAYVIALIVLLPNLIAIKWQIGYIFEKTAERYDFSKTIVKQIDYPSAEANSREWHGMTVYYPIEGDQLWYDKFISVPYGEAYDNIEWYGDSIKDGLYLKQ